MIILDVKTPTCCFNCPCYDGMDGSSYCMAGEKNVEDGDIRQEWCPIYGEVYIGPDSPTDIRVSADIPAMANSARKTPEKWVRVGIGKEL